MLKQISKESMKFRAIQSIWQNLFENRRGPEMILQPHVH